MSKLKESIKNKIVKKFNSFIEEMNDEMNDEMDELINNELLDIKHLFIEKIQTHLFQGLELIKCIDDNNSSTFFILDFKDDIILELNDKGEIIVESDKQGTAYGWYIIQVIKDYLKEHPNEDPKKIFIDIRRSVLFAISEAAKDFGIDLYEE